MQESERRTADQTDFSTRHFFPEESERQFPTGQTRGDIDRQTGIVLELEIMGAIGDGRIQADRKVSDGGRMVIALHDFQAGLQNRIEQGAGDLADTAAHRVHQTAMHDLMRFAEAVVRAPLSDRVVIGKDFARLQQFTVDMAGRDGDVVEPRLSVPRT